MTDTPKKPKKANPITRAKEPVTVSKDEVYEIFVELFCNRGGNVTIKAAYEEIMRRDPTAKLSYRTIAVWAKAHDWMGRAATVLENEIVSALNPYRPAMADDALCGLQGQMIMHIHHSIEQTSITDPEALLKFVESIVKLGDLRKPVPASSGLTNPEAHRTKLAEVIGNVRQLKTKK